MPLGTRDLLIAEGDLVRVISHKAGRNASIPVGTMAPILRILPGKTPKYELEGYPSIFLEKTEIEIISYIRRHPPAGAQVERGDMKTGPIISRCLLSPSVGTIVTLEPDDVIEGKANI